MGEKQKDQDEEFNRGDRPPRRVDSKRGEKLKDKRARNNSVIYSGLFRFPRVCKSLPFSPIRPSFLLFSAFSAASAVNPLPFFSAVSEWPKR
jgi:hypothetical protein